MTGVAKAKWFALVLTAIGCRTPQKERDHLMKHSNFISALLFAALLLVSVGNALAQGSAATDREASGGTLRRHGRRKLDRASRNWKTTAPMGAWSRVITFGQPRVAWLNTTLERIDRANSVRTRKPVRADRAVALRQPAERGNSGRASAT